MANTPIQNRYDFMFVYDVSNGNPNGDPDCDGMPRVDPATGRGYVTDKCIKRKIRNRILEAKDEETGYRIYVKEGIPLSRNERMAYNDLGYDEKKLKELHKDEPELDRIVKDWMCSNFWDIRTFGAVLTTHVKNGLNCGQVSGPVQISYSESVDVVQPTEVTLSRVTVTKEEDISKKKSDLGRQYILPYGLFVGKGYISASRAKNTGFSEDDLELLWDAIENMFEDDRSATRGEMTLRKLIIFRHQSALGNAQAGKLFDRVKVTRKPNDGSAPARCFDDYEVTIDLDNLPNGVTCEVRE